MSCLVYITKSIRPPIQPEIMIWFQFVMYGIPWLPGRLNNTNLLNHGSQIKWNKLLHIFEKYQFSPFLIKVYSALHKSFLAQKSLSYGLLINGEKHPSCLQPSCIGCILTEEMIIKLILKLFLYTSHKSPCFDSEWTDGTAIWGLDLIICSFTCLVCIWYPQ